MAIPQKIQNLLDQNSDYVVTPRGVEKTLGNSKTELIVSLKGLDAEVKQPVADEDQEVSKSPKKSYYKKKHPVNDTEDSE